MPNQSIPFAISAASLAALAYCAAPDASAQISGTSENYLPNIPALDGRFFSTTRFGVSIAAIGDINGDGYDDIAVGTGPMTGI